MKNDHETKVEGSVTKMTKCQNPREQKDKDKEGARKLKRLMTYSFFFFFLKQFIIVFLKERDSIGQQRGTIDSL
jgi:hypothetical protein